MTLWEKLSEKLSKANIYGHFPIIDKTINIGRKIPQIIDNLKELSAKLLIPKMAGELSKIYRYRKK